MLYGIFTFSIDLRYPLCLEVGIHFSQKSDSIFGNQRRRDIGFPMRWDFYRTINNGAFHGLRLDAIMFSSISF